MKLDHGGTTALMAGFQGAPEAHTGHPSPRLVQRSGVGWVRMRKALLEERAAQRSPEGQVREPGGEFIMTATSASGEGLSAEG